jgi:uncharacterized protein YggE
MADARLRADAYAEAAGLVLGPLLEVVEVGADHPRRNMRLPAGVGYVVSGSTPEMPTHTEGLQIIAEVEVTYFLTTP